MNLKIWHRRQEHENERDERAASPLVPIDSGDPIPIHLHGDPQDPADPHIHLHPADPHIQPVPPPPGLIQYNDPVKIDYCHEEYPALEVNGRVSIWPGPEIGQGTKALSASSAEIRDLNVTHALTAKDWNLTSATVDGLTVMQQATVTKARIGPSFNSLPPNPVNPADPALEVDTGTVVRGPVGIGPKFLTKNNSAAPAKALEVEGECAATGNLIVGTGGNARLRTRHVDGKRSDNDTPESLYLNYDNGNSVHIGGGKQADLAVHGSTMIDRDLHVSGKIYGDLGTSGNAEPVMSFASQVVDIYGTKSVNLTFPGSWMPDPAVCAMLSGFTAATGGGSPGPFGGSLPAWNSHGPLTAPGLAYADVVVQGTPYIDGAGLHVTVHGRCVSIRPEENDACGVKCTVLVIGRKRP